MYFLMILGMTEVNKFAQIRFILKAKFGDDSLLLVVRIIRIGPRQKLKSLKKKASSNTVFFK